MLGRGSEEKSKYIDDDGNVIKMPGADYQDSLQVWNQKASHILGPQKALLGIKPLVFRWHVILDSLLSMQSPSSPPRPTAT